MGLPPAQDVSMHVRVLPLVCLIALLPLTLQAQSIAPSQTPVEAAAPQPAEPARLPPVGSPPLVRFIQLDFPTQGGMSVIEPQTYLYYIQTQPSRSSDGVWVPYDEKTVLEDFRRLWATNFLDDLWIEV
jgi:hypothetical protein